jgi:hypothetical protein
MSSGRAPNEEILRTICLGCPKNGYRRRGRRIWIRVADGMSSAFLYRARDENQIVVSGRHASIAAGHHLEEAGRQEQHRSPHAKSRRTLYSSGNIDAGGDLQPLAHLPHTFRKRIQRLGSAAVVTQPVQPEPQPYQSDPPNPKDKRERNHFLEGEASHGVCRGTHLGLDSNRTRGFQCQWSVRKGLQG